MVEWKKKDNLRKWEKWKLPFSQRRIRSETWVACGSTPTSLNNGHSIPRRLLSFFQYNLYWFVLFNNQKESQKNDIWFMRWKMRIMRSLNPSTSPNFLMKGFKPLLCSGRKNLFLFFSVFLLSLLFSSFPPTFFGLLVPIINKFWIKETIKKLKTFCWLTRLRNYPWYLALITELNVNSDVVNCESQKGCLNLYQLKPRRR